MKKIIIQDNDDFVIYVVKKGNKTYFECIDYLNNALEYCKRIWSIKEVDELIDKRYWRTCEDCDVDIKIVRKFLRG